MSIEALGSFEEDNWHQAILAAHIGILHHLTFKIGGSVGLTKDTPDFSPAHRICLPILDPDDFRAITFTPRQRATHLADRVWRDRTHPQWQSVSLFTVEAQPSATSIAGLQRYPT
jgi:hypothetical protein